MRQGIDVREAVLRSSQGAHPRPIMITAFALIGALQRDPDRPDLPGMAISLMFGVSVPDRAHSCWSLRRVASRRSTVLRRERSPRRRDADAGEVLRSNSASRARKRPVREGAPAFRSIFGAICTM